MNDKIKILKEGGVGVMPTDTIYGLVGSALIPSTVERIYELRERNPNKPMIVLISDLKDLFLFDIEINPTMMKQIKKFWPGKVSIIFTCRSKKFEYLHRGKETLAFRLPNDEKLLEVLKAAGPLVAPSANIADEKPASNIKEAKKYFNNKIDFYIDAGKIENSPSKVIELKNGQVKVLRK